MEEQVFYAALQEYVNGWEQTSSLPAAEAIAAVLRESDEDSSPTDSHEERLLRELLDQLTSSLASETGRDATEVVDNLPGPAAGQHSDHEQQLSRWRRLMNAVTYFTQNQVESPGGAEALSAAWLAVRNVLVIGFPALALPWTAYLAENYLPRDDKSDPDGRTRMAIGLTVGLLLPLAQSLAGSIREYRRGTLTCRSVAAQGATHLIQTASEAIAASSGDLQKLVPNMIGVSVSRALGLILANVVELESVIMAARSGHIPPNNLQSTTVTALTNTLLASGLTFSSDSAAFGEDQQNPRQVNDHGFTRPENYLPNASFTVVGHTAFDVAQKIWSNWRAGTVERIRICVRWPGFWEWIEISTADLGAATISAQNNNLVTSLVTSKATSNKWLQILVSTLVSGAMTGVETLANRLISKKTPEEPAMHEEEIYAGASSQPRRQQVHIQIDPPAGPSQAPDLEWLLPAEDQGVYADPEGLHAVAPPPSPQMQPLPAEGLAVRKYRLNDQLKRRG
ncbi:MAG: hypothetical protein JWP38_1365 [Herbaspirillum sp.]|nr:hypothetical protein [Herbaspirillum sp.]